MIDYDGLRRAVVTGLKAYLGVPIVRSNQNEEMPPYPYISYTVTTLASSNKGTYGRYADGIDRKPVTQTWSITALASDNTESVTLACKAREWLDYVGTTYLSDNKVDVQSVGNITNRDNFLTTEYEYRNGFDVFFWLYDEVGSPVENDGYIEAVDLGNAVVEPPKTEEELNNMLEKRLEGD